MAKIKLPIVTINAKGGAQYVVEGIEAVNALTQLENYPERGIRIKVDGKTNSNYRRLLMFCNCYWRC